MGQGSGPRRVDPARLPRLWAAAQLLDRPATARDPVEVARVICGAQAQDERAGRLAFRARSRRLRAVEVERARTEDRSLVRTWAMRGTLHLLATDDVGWLLPLFEPAVAEESRRRLAQLGIEPATQRRALGEIERALDSGPLTRAELAELLERDGIALDQSTRLHVIRLAIASGIACLGPNRGRQTCLVLRHDWLPVTGRHDREASLAELARRHMGAFGPATEADLAGWSGLALGEVRRGMGAIARELVELRLGDEVAWALRSAPHRLPRRGIVRLLPAFDTYLLGRRDRDRIVASAELRRIIPGGGMIHPAILVDGVAVGTWRIRRAGNGLKIDAHPFAPLGERELKALEGEVADVGRFEGLPAALGSA